MSHAPHGWVPSKRLRSAARSEQKRIEREIERLTRQEARHRRELERIESKKARLRDELLAVERFAEAEGVEPPRLRVVENKPRRVAGSSLKGIQIREFAVRLIVGTEEAERGIHYRTWFELLKSNGIEIAGRDPQAVFLTQLSRSPVVKKTDRPGVYALDTAYPDRAARALEELDLELGELAEMESSASVEEIEKKRERAKRIRSERRSLERSIQEAKRSLAQA